MKKYKWELLQLFAEGAGDGAGDGSGASTTVVEGADDGRQRLMELGVPESKLRKNRAYKVGAPKGQAAAAEQTAPAEEQPGQAAAAEDNQPTEGNGTARMSWDEIKKDPEYSKEISKLVQERLKKNGADGDNHAKMAEANRALARYYGLDPNNIDYDALAKKVTSDNALVEARAARNGVDPDIQRKLDEFESLKERDQRFNQEQMRRKMLEDHYQGLKPQAEAMKAVFPNFDLDRELATNREFARLVGPGVNVPVEKAYMLCHHDEIMAAAAQAAQKQTAQKIANSIRSGSRRPVENGTSGQAPSVSTFDYRKASREQREAFKQQIREAAARGEYIRPGRR